ncbi:MAG: ribonuclease P protein component [Reichenbachiella sp.]
MEDKTEITRHFKFPKKERLHSKKLIDALFSEGASFHLYPFTLKYLSNPSPEADCHQVMVSVSKKKYKRAVDRNRIKRIIKEAYRLQKHEKLSESINGSYLLISYIYMAKEIHSYDFIEKKLIESLRRLSDKLQKG